MTKDYGIGYGGEIPWKCPSELKLFKKKTNGSVIIVGRKTATTLPYLKNRTVICLSKNTVTDLENKVITFPSLDSALRSNLCVNNKVFIAGGAEIYNYVFKYWMDKIDKVHLSVLKKDAKCDTFVSFDLHNLCLDEKSVEHEDFYHYVLKPIKTDEWNYLKLLNHVMHNGIVRKGRNGETKSLFGKTIKFNLTRGFPLLTTKKMFFRGVFEELLFFIRGETDSKKLEEKKVNIWKGNTNREFLNSLGKTERLEGMMGEMYGYQWRSYNSPYDEKTGKPLKKGLDQLKDVVNKIRTDPTSRRIMMTSYNPLQADGGVLYPCHSIILQFYVSGKYLDMFCYNRSSDLFHGLPFNIASSSLLLIFIAKITGYVPRNFILSLGDLHIYESHYEVVQKQLERLPFKMPSIIVKTELLTINDIENLSYEDIELVEYKYHPSIKANMVA